MSYHYTVIFEEQPEGGYHVFCPALPGCHSEGDTYDEALKNIREAMELYLDSLKEHGDLPPLENYLIKPLEISL